MGSSYTQQSRQNRVDLRRVQIETLQTLTSCYQNMKVYENWIHDLYAEFEVSEKDGVLTTPKGEKAYLVEELPQDIIVLTNGKFLIKSYGKYGAHLCFISPVPRLDWEKATRMQFNLPNGELKQLTGEYFVSKKGTKCFRIGDGPHIILQDDWGGAFNKYRGRTLPEDQVYFRRASSNGGGCGYDYAIVPKDWKLQITEDDL